MSFDKVLARMVQSNPSSKILNLVHLLARQPRLTVSGIVLWASFETIYPPPVPSHSVFFWVHFETPLTEFKNLESWDGPFLYLHILLGTTLRGKKILPYIEPDLS